MSTATQSTSGAAVSGLHGAVAALACWARGGHGVKRLLTTGFQVAIGGKPQWHSY